MKAFSRLILLLLLAIAIEGSSGARTGGGNLLAPSSVKKTIESEDGDFVDCVDIYKQPAFDHPKLKSHIIQMSSTQHANIRGSSAATTGAPIPQAWQRSGSCPQGTIPILRTPKNLQHMRTALPKANGGAGEYLKNAVAYDVEGPFVGVSGSVQAWRAHAEPNEHSMNLVLCTSLRADRRILDLVGVGSAVSPVIYGDNNTRLIIIWTKDNTNDPFCANLDCPGFVQTSKEIVLGAILPKLSVYGDPDHQYIFDIQFYLDQDQQRWWVAINSYEVGYFPTKIFTDFGECDVALWGGAIYSSKLVPTLTEMGNGHFSGEGQTRTGAIYNALVRRRGAGTVRQPPSGYIISRPQCYDMTGLGPGVHNLPGNTYLYGGPGTGSPKCT